MKLKELSLKYSFLPFSFYYLGPVVFATYLYSLKSCFAKWKINTLISLFLFLALASVLIIKQDPVDSIYVLRYFWGWIFFFIFFSSGYRINLNIILKTLCILVIGEAIIVNSLIDPYLLPNYPDPAVNHLVRDGGFQRPYSFGGSATVTSAILVTLMASLKLNLRSSLLPIVATITCQSGTGFYLLILYFLHEIIVKRAFFLCLLFAVILISLAFGLTWKFTFEYFQIILNLKVEQAINIVEGSLSDEFFFGVNKVQATGVGGDFQFLSFFELNGFFGLLIFGIILLLNLNRYNYLPIFLMVLGSFHYGVIFSFPGQFLFGYFLALRVLPNDCNDSIKLNYRAKKN